MGRVQLVASAAIGSNWILMTSVRCVRCAATSGTRFAAARAIRLEARASELRLRSSSKRRGCRSPLPAASKYASRCRCAFGNHSWLDGTHRGFARIHTASETNSCNQLLIG